jgi:hypothetical protein
MDWTVVGTPESSTILYNKFRAIVLTTACVFHVATRSICRVSRRPPLLPNRKNSTTITTNSVRKTFEEHTSEKQKDCKLNNRSVHFKPQFFYVEVFFQIRWTQLFRLEVQNAIGIKFFLLFKSYVLFEKCYFCHILYFMLHVIFICYRK